MKAVISVLEVEGGGPFLVRALLVDGNSLQSSKVVLGITWRKECAQETEPSWLL
jgi:hypothetical protein